MASFVAPTVVSPFAGIPAARWRPERVLAAVTTLRVLAVALTVGLIAFDGPIVLLVPLVLLESGAGAIGRSLQIALQPLLARSPAELVAANVAAGTAEGLGTFAGPAVSAVLLAVAGPVGAYLGVLAIYALAVASIAGMHVPPTRPGQAPSVRKELGRRPPGGPAASRARADPDRVLDSGRRPRRTHRPDGRRRHRAVRDGRLRGGPAERRLRRGRRDRRHRGSCACRADPHRAVVRPALAGWGVPVVILGLIVSPVFAIALMVMVGASNAVLDVAGFTLLQRAVPNAARVAVMGLLISGAGATMAVGGFVAPILVDMLGIQGALVATG